jgi:hypothetical protein
MISKSKTSRQLQDYSSQQAKQLLWCHVVAAGSSYQVEEAVDAVISRPAALL